MVAVKHQDLNRLGGAIVLMSLLMGTALGYALIHWITLGKIDNLQSWTLAISSNSGGSTSPSGNQTYTDGQNASIQAIPDNGYQLGHWVLDGLWVNVDNSNPYNLTIRANHTLNAMFAQLPLYLDENWSNGSYSDDLANPSVGYTEYSSNPIISYDSQNWCSSNTEEPMIVQHNSTHWFMFYEGYNPSTPTKYSIGCAYSTDLITWTPWKNNPVFSPSRNGFDDTGVGNPAVLRINSTHWYMWYGGCHGYYWQIGLAYTTHFPDNWIRLNHGNPVLSPSADWELSLVAAPAVARLSDGTYRMYYEGRSLSPSERWSIGLATSSDGISWKKYNGNPIITSGTQSCDIAGVSGPSLWYNASRWELYYTGHLQKQGDGGICMAYSSDGITFTKYANNPVIPLGGLGQWDSSTIPAPFVYKTSTMYYVYYEGDMPGRTYSHSYQIGVAYQRS